MKQKRVKTLILVIGIILISTAWISEILFHYVQEFNTDVIDPAIFWKFEPVEALNSTILLSTGILLIIIYVLMTRKKRKRK